MPALLLALALLLVPRPAALQEQVAPSTGVRAHFEAFGAEGCFVGFEASGRDWIRHGGELCRTRFVPASTFKILNSLIVLETVRGIMVEAEGAGWTLRAKTGWGRPEGGVEVGWKVGWVDRGEERFFFAVLIRPPAGAFPMRRAQEEITRGILEELGVL